MIWRTLTSLGLVAGCAIALTLPAQAQVIDTQGQLRTAAPRFKTGDQIQWVADSNNMDGAQYERLLQTDPAFRQSRMMKECGPITNAHLQAGCVDSFSMYEDQRSVGSKEGLTGGSTGIMNPMGLGPYSPKLPISDAGR